MNLNRIIVVLVVLITGIFLTTAGSFAGKPEKPCSPWPSCKDDGGKPPPPTGCMDTFPGFLYHVRGTRKLPAELRLSSSNGCRTELVATSTHLERVAFHMTADRLKGVVVWSEDPEHNFHSIVWRRDFTVDESSGDLIFDPAVTILPLVGEEAPEGDTLGYGSIDIWGDATHSSLFLVTGRRYGFGSGGANKEMLVYDLNALINVDANPGVRQVYQENILTWGGYPDWQGVVEPDCNNPEAVNGVNFPRFVPSCYRPEGFRFNPSGTHIYVSGKLFLMDGRREYAEMRIKFDSTGSSDPDEWDITGPEMVYVNGPRIALPRPSPLADELGQPLPQVLPSPEIVMADNQFLDADQCAKDYAYYSNGDKDSQLTIWLGCLVNDLLAIDGIGESWDSPDSYLFYRNAQHDREIFRFYVSDGIAGTEEILIDNGQSPDAGF